MADSPILGIPEVLPNQAAKEVTINDGFSISERAANATGVVDMTAGNVDLTASPNDFKHHMVLRCEGHTVPRTLTIPAQERWFAVHNAGTGVVTVDPGAGASVNVAVGSKCLLACDGVDVELIADSAAVTIPGLDGLTDVTITTPVAGQILEYNGSAWVNGSRYPAPVNITATGEINAASHAGKFLHVSSATDVTLTIDAEADGAWPADTEMSGVQYNTGKVIFAVQTGSLRVPTGCEPNTRDQYSSFALKRLASNEWLLTGDLELT